MDNKTFIICGIIIALAIGVLAVFLASSNPDGLESTALIVQGQKSLTGDTPPDAEIKEDLNGKFSYASPMPDYSLGEQFGTTGGLIAIIVGTLLAFLVVLGALKCITMMKSPEKSKPNQ
jgi:cobalt/nickel transport protein